MKKLINLVLAAVLFLSITTTVFGQDLFNTPIDVLQKVEKSSVSILSIGTKGFSSCSGTIIKENETEYHVLTAKHCINIDEEIYANNVKVKLVISSPSDDLAYLILEDKIKGKEPIELAINQTKTGNTVHHVGYPHSKLYTKSGEITNITDDWQLANFASIGGCSGGGIFDKDAKLVGVLWGGFLFESISIFEPLNDINKFLDTIKDNVNKYKNEKITN